MLKFSKRVPGFGDSPFGAVGIAAVTAALAGCVVAPAPPPRAPVAVVGVQVREAPPPLPDYEQPPCPEDGFLWTPGYWAWAAGGYYWVPGTWVAPPRVGVLWTPGYWGFAGGVYVFHAGYWGPHVGFYGGVNYGFGYGGVGFAGGAWRGGAFAYNQSVTNVNVTVVHNTYNTTVVNNVTVNKVSYNGGAGGVAAAPTQQERQFAQEQHIAPTQMQQQHLQQASQNPALAARSNGGHPSIAATPRPTAFNAPGVVGAHGAGAQAPARTPFQARESGPNQGSQGQAANVTSPPNQSHPQNLAAGNPQSSGGGGQNGAQGQGHPGNQNPQGQHGGQPNQGAQALNQHRAQQPRPHANPPHKPEAHAKKEEEHKQGHRDENH